MPTLNEANVRHLLRRTEIVDRPDRVAELLSHGSIESVVDDVMDVRATPPSATFEGLASDEGWRRGLRLSGHWLSEMTTARRPFAERMALFWHGHIVSSLDKVQSVPAMQGQLDLFRRRGLGPQGDSGNVSALLVEMSTQPAMLRYLDNDQNFADSPNQNFARELMELFVIGVGNYTEADVEAATAAWTGHSRERWDSDTYVYRSDRHETLAQSFLGRTINDSRPGREAGRETIEVMLGTGPLGSGTIPVGPNAGRPSDRVAAEFLTFKLWQEFGEAETRGVPAGVGTAMVTALLDSGFDIRPWVRAMLTHDDFYSDTAKNGLVRQPIEYAVALYSATGLDAVEHSPDWLLERAGQRPLRPPNVSGWKPNGYWVNASAMGARQSMVDHVGWRAREGTYDGRDGYIQLGHDRLSRVDIDGFWSSETGHLEPVPADQLVDDLERALGLSVSASTRRRVIDHVDDDTVADWMRLDALSLILSAPEMHIA